MKILAITNMYPSPERPGHGVFVEEQIKGLRAVGLQVQTLFVDRKKDGPRAYYNLRNRINESMVEFEPDVIHVMYGGVMADQVVRRHHLRPVVVTFHGSDLLGENLSGWTRKLISHYGVYCSRRAAQLADGVVVVARHLLSALPGSAVQARARVIPCGIDLERFSPMDSLACKNRLGWNPQSFHVLFASSNGDPVKRPELARAAVVQMEATRKPEHNWSTGRRPGVYPAHAVATGQETGAPLPVKPAEFHYLTGIPNADVPLWLNASDVLLLTSLHEGSPTVVKEALACGLPVVSVAVGDVAERIEGIEGCHLAAPDPAALAAKLCLVRQSAQRLDCRARLEALSVATVADKLQQLYRGVIQEQGTARTVEHASRFFIPVNFLTSCGTAFAKKITSATTAPNKRPEHRPTSRVHPN